MKTSRVRWSVFVSACAAGVAAAQCEDTQRVTAEPPVEGARFGASVAAQGEWLLAGSPEDSTIVQEGGAVDIFRLVDGEWEHFDTIRPIDLAEFDDFGRSVAIDGERLVIGAPGADPIEDNEGAAYVFEFDGESWNEVDKLTHIEPGAGDRYGWDVAIEGDLVIVGAFGADVAANSGGAAYAMRYDGESWIEEGVLVADDAVNVAQLGRSVALQNGLALVGAWQDDDAGFATGAAYTFEFDGKTWVQQQKLVASDAAGFAWFGRDVDLDGSQAIIGAYGDAEEGLEAGAAYIFVFDGESWIESAKLTAEVPAPGARFGWSVSLDGVDAWIGAPLENEAAKNAGAAYLFRSSGFGWNERVKVATAVGGEQAEFGSAVQATAGQVFVGAPFWDQGETLDVGAVVAYSGCLCPADFNGDGLLNVLDFVAFQIAWVAQNSSADCDQNDQYNILDFVCYSELYSAGCP